MAGHYDRSAEDIGNIVALEHVNLGIADQTVGTLFYMSGLGLTRDPYMMTSVDNMWINVGASSQFHLPTMKPQHLRGRVGLVIPDRAALLRRLETIAKFLKDTQFAFTEHNDHVEAICPWGNHFLCHDPAPQFGRMFTGRRPVNVTTRAPPLSCRLLQCVSLKADSKARPMGAFE